MHKFPKDPELRQKWEKQVQRTREQWSAEGLATNEISYATRRNQLKSTEIRDRNQHLCIETRSTRRGLYSHTHYVVEIKVEIQKSTEISYAFLAVADPSRVYAPLFCMLALGETGEEAYTRDSDIAA